MSKSHTKRYFAEIIGFQSHEMQDNFELDQENFDGRTLTYSIRIPGYKILFNSKCNLMELSDILKKNITCNHDYWGRTEANVSCIDGRLMVWGARARIM